ncbi:MAG TPA: DUF3137 domain-containing protein [Chitinophaga sp.]|uniref:DUF3137 domain-containing protein n=1 Tax=Chitinophaga sp. TaxID=1869181 RepID=UPI002C47FDC2|nr:DUF3137 domain-containing protein [Chitinophaga sp.]HVI44294.1 DUF3137 domain-containing protein [Chitinophaga sp.]
MKTLEEFSAFVDQQLDKDLKDLEQKRVAGRAWIRRMWILGILPVVLFFIFIIRPAMDVGRTDTSGGNDLFVFVIAGALLMAGAGFLIRHFMMRTRGATEIKDYQQDFKNRVVRRIIAFINPEYTYQPLNYASYEEFTENGLFSRKDYRITGNDQVFGKTGEMNFQFCDLKVTHMPLVTLRGQDADVVFEGSYFIAQFPRYFSTPVYVISRVSMSENLFASPNANEGYIETWSLGKKVLPSDAAFNKAFMVYAKDVEEAQQLLTPVLLQKIAALQERSQAKLFISFYSNRIYIGISHGRDYFEAGLDESLNNQQLLKDYYLDFLTQLQMVEDLKQNVSIWTTTAFSRS